MDKFTLRSITLNLRRILPRSIAVTATAVPFVAGSALPAFAEPISAAMLAFSAFLASGTTAAAIVSFAINTIISIAVSTLLGKIFGEKPDLNQRGTELEIQIGDTTPLTFCVGHTGTAGKRKYVNSWGEEGKTPNAYITDVIELGNIPCAGLDGILADGKRLTILWDEPDEGGKGFPIDDFRDDDGEGDPFMWIRFHDGTQTVADSFLLSTFENDTERPWTDGMVGFGCPYVICTYKHNPEVLSGIPNLVFEPGPARFYDIRKDGTNGGVGNHRWNNPATWEATLNNAVIIYNLIRGVYYQGEWIFGGRNLAAFRLPSANWIAAANACDNLVDIPDDEQEPEFTCGYEVFVNNDAIDIINELRKGCNARLAEIGGIFKIAVGYPGAAIFSITDADLLNTEASQLDPFPAFTDTHNGVEGTYPDPDSNWTMKDAPALYDAELELKDNDNRLVMGVEFTSTFNVLQVQRLMSTLKDDNRKFRTHLLPLPPDAYGLELNDVISWSSEHNGYIEKDFLITDLKRIPGFLLMISVKELDPDDYDYDSPYVVPDSTGWVGPIRKPPHVATGWGFYADSFKDDQGADRRPTIRAVCAQDMTNIARVQVQVRLKSSGALVFDSDQLRYEEPWEWKLNAFFLPSTIYECRGRYIPRKVHRSLWSGWFEVTTLNVRLQEGDFGDQVWDHINALEDAANDAAALAVAAQAKVDELEDVVDTFNADVLDQVQTIIDELSGVATGDIQELRGIALAGYQQDSWVKDKTFAYFTAGNLDYWSDVGISLYGAQVSNGIRPSSLLMDIPTSAGVCYVQASSNISNELSGYNLKAEYVTVGLVCTILEGSPTTASLRPEWLIGGVWVRPNGFGNLNTEGRLIQEWGISSVADPNTLISKRVVFQKPAGTPTAVRVFLRFKSTVSTTPLKMHVQVCDMYESTQAEIDATNAGAYAEAKISEFALTLTGPEGSLAALRTDIQADWEDADAAVSDSIVAVANNVSALASKITTIESQFGGTNLVKNPIFQDGIRPLGDPPNYWQSGWDSNMRVYQRGQAYGAAVSQAITPFVGFIGVDNVTHEARAHGPVAILPGQLVQCSLSYACIGTTPTPNFQFGMRIRWLDADQNVMFGTAMTETVNSVAWRNSDFTPKEAPAGAAFFTSWVYRPSGGVIKDTVFTNVQARVLDDVVYAAATQAQTTAATATSALASISSTVSSEFSDFNAFVSATATALTRSEGSISAYVVRAGVDGALRLYAWDDVDSNGTAISLDADNVLVPGTLSTGTLVITDLGYNKVPDDQLQSVISWSTYGNPFQVIKNTPLPTPDSQGEIRWYKPTGGPNTGFHNCDSRVFPVRPSQRLSASFQMARWGASGQCRGQASIVFFNKVGSNISSETIATIDLPLAAVQQFTRRIVVPAGAFRAVFRWRADLNTTADGLRFFSPSVISNEDASVLITPDDAFFASLSAKEAWIGSANIDVLTVDTIHIKNGALSNMATGIMGANIEVEDDNTYYTVASVTINKLPIQATLIWTHVNLLQKAAYSWTSGGPFPEASTVGLHQYRFRRGTVTIWQSDDQPLPFFVDDTSIQGNVTYTLQIQTKRGDSPGWGGGLMGSAGRAQPAIANSAAIACLQLKK